MMIRQIFTNEPESMKEVYSVSVENVVASGKLEQRLDLNLISGTIPGARYNPKRFPGLFFNLKNPKCLLLIFNSGKIISMGTRSVRQAKKAIINAVKELQSIGMTILTKPKIAVQNMVACADLKTVVDLEDLAMTMRRTIYEPENFPGLIYMMDQPKVTLLIFTNGKIVCAGAKSESDILRAVKTFHKILETNGFADPSNLAADKKIEASVDKEMVFSDHEALAQPLI